MKIDWLKSAQTDLNSIFDYILAHNPQAALRTYDVIRQKVELLANHPHLGRAGRVGSTRELVIAGTPYVVVYAVDDRAGTIVILRVLHSKRRWPDDLGAEDSDNKDLG